MVDGVNNPTAEAGDLQVKDAKHLPHHDRQVDRLPASFGLAEASKVFPGYVPGAVEVAVDLISAG
jgi:hypothetical protein